MQIDVRRPDELSTEERDALRALSVAVYPPEVAASWPGRLIEWSSHQWCILCRGDDGRILSHAGALLRDGTAGGRPARIGGVGGVKTHPHARGRGLGSAVVRRAVELLGGQGADFALLVCEPALVPFYERLGWVPHAGGLLVRRHSRSIEFAFNLPMVHPLREAAATGGDRPAGAAVVTSDLPVGPRRT
jgi:GNAT superfamily N-acetyltransferase